jgi:UDP-N-acetylmuramoyl-L-alanine---L-glutamate ligase
MRPALSWADLAGRRVGLYGLGREGEAALAACRVRGIEPLLVDDAPHDPGVLATGAGGLEALLSCEIVVKSPGISPYGAAVSRLAAAGVTLVGGLGLWLAGADRSRVACITGTKGKSTTTAIAGHLLDRLGYRALVGGNIGVPPFDPEVAGQPSDYWLIEVSSYQARDVAVSPPVVGVTSLNPDHLPWHADDVETYYRDKLSLCSQPGADWTVANGDSALLRERRPELGPRVRWVTADRPAAWAAPLGLLGVHNHRNALIARELLRLLGVKEADDDEAMRGAAEGFAGLESRLQTVASVGAVRFVDDGLSTNVLGTLAAVEAFPAERVALIVGGQDRGIDYRPLAEGLRARRAPLLVLTIPDNGPRIAAALRSEGSGPAVEVAEAEGLDEAVRAGFAWVGQGVVLLSPAAPSFGRYRDYRERGAAFTEAAHRVSTA